jgi:hypothetical protein
MILSFNYRGNSNYSEFSEKILAVGYTGTLRFYSALQAITATLHNCCLSLKDTTVETNSLFH